MVWLLKHDDNVLVHVMLCLCVLDGHKKLSSLCTDALISPAFCLYVLVERGVVPGCNRGQSGVCYQFLVFFAADACAHSRNLDSAFPATLDLRAILSFCRTAAPRHRVHVSQVLRASLQAFFDNTGSQSMSAVDGDSGRFESVCDEHTTCTYRLQLQQLAPGRIFEVRHFKVPLRFLCEVALVAFPPRT